MNFSEISNWAGIIWLENVIRCRAFWRRSMGINPDSRYRPNQAEAGKWEARRRLRLQSLLLLLCV